jgi:hypothetical protein
VVALRDGGDGGRVGRAVGAEQERRLLVRDHPLGQRGRLLGAAGVVGVDQPDPVALAVGHDAAAPVRPVGPQVVALLRQRRLVHQVAAEGERDADHDVGALPGLGGRAAADAARGDHAQARDRDEQLP